MTGQKRGHRLAVARWLDWLNRLHKAAPDSIPMFTYYVSSLIDELHLICDEDAFYAGVDARGQEPGAALAAFHADLQSHPMAALLRSNRKCILLWFAMLFPGVAEEGALLDFGAAFQADFRSCDVCFLRGMRAAPSDRDRADFTLYSEVWKQALSFLPDTQENRRAAEALEALRESARDALEEDPLGYEYLRAVDCRCAALLEHGWAKGVAASVTRAGRGARLKAPMGRRSLWQPDLDSYDRYLAALRAQLAARGLMEEKRLAQLPDRTEAFTLTLYPYAYSYGFQVGTTSLET